MIKDIRVRPIENSCGKKTVRIKLVTEKGDFSACAAAGTSEGSHEAKAIKIDSAIRYFPRYKPKFVGQSEKQIDHIIEEVGLDKLGVHISIALSIAAIRAVSNNDVYKFLNPKAKKLPLPLGNVVGGGSHKGYLTEQEFLVFPKKAKTMQEAIETNQKIWETVGKILKSKKMVDGNNFEGAWMCKLDDIKTLDLLKEVADQYGAGIGMDIAASEYFKNGIYYYKNPERRLSSDKQLDFVLGLIEAYNLEYVEDPFHEDDFQNFSRLTKKAKTLIVGDDLFVTQEERLKQGIKKGAGNGIIIKPDQAGTISRTLKTVKLADKAKYKTIVSHRSGETKDSFISDLAVGIGSPLIKCGIFGRERKSKHDRLKEIWKNIEYPKLNSI
ncbi:MAG: enolase [Candidatus Aenigmarchaeota archaeon]|nr:enolase [Candidatus Aenigmarchaeota archaeon]